MFGFSIVFRKIFYKTGHAQKIVITIGPQFGRV